MSKIKTVVREEFGDQLARTMEPDAWAEFDAGNGVCSNDSGFKCLDSIKLAALIMNFLADQGPIIVPQPSAESLANLRADANLS